MAKSLISNLKDKYKKIIRKENEIEEINELISDNNNNSNNNYNYNYLLDYIQQKKLKQQEEKQQQQQNNNNNNNCQFQKIGLLFIIIDDLPHELIWRVWLNSIENQNKYEIFIHAKNPKKVVSSWVKSYLVDFCLSPEWGSVEITKVMIKLLRKSVEFSLDISHFCFISESCIPTVSFNEAIEMIENDNKSWIKWKSQANNGYAQQLQFEPLYNYIPQECIFKSDQWILLKRIHVIELISFLDSLPFDLFQPFYRVKASDEIFIPTCLSLLNYVTKLSSTEIEYDQSQFSNRCVTFAQWTIENSKSPTTFSHIFQDNQRNVLNQNQLNNNNNSIYKLAKDEKTLFMRKIMNNSIKYDPSNSSSSSLNQVMEGRVELLSEWCEVIYNYRDIREQSLERDENEEKHIQIMKEIIETVRNDYFESVEHFENRSNIREIDESRGRCRSRERNRNYNYNYSRSHSSNRRSRSKSRSRSRSRDGYSYQDNYRNRERYSDYRKKRSRSRSR